MASVNPDKALRRYLKPFANQRAAAKSLDITQQYLCDMLHHRRPISVRILGRLGLVRVAVYRRVQP